MNVVIKDTSNMDKLTESLKKLGKERIKVGVFGDKDSEIAKIAGVHEYGMTIRPKNGKYLAIPSHPRSKGKSPRDYNNLFFIPTKNGNGLLARNKGKDEFVVYFVLVKSVTIPERSFIRAGFDNNVNNITKKIEGLLQDVIDFKIDTNVFLDAIGEEFASMIQDYATNLSSPGKAKVTLAASPNKTNPLIDTGQMIKSIRHIVE